MHQYKQNQIKHQEGLREIDLRLNKLGDRFLHNLSGCLKFDSYIKAINLSHNKFSYDQLKHFVRSNCLNENNSVLCLDVRYNTGANEKILKNVSL